MSTAELDRAANLLGVVEPEKWEELRAAVTEAARRYLRCTSQENTTPSLSRQKAQLVKVKNAAGRLVEEVEKLALNPDAEFAFLYQLQRWSWEAEISHAAGVAKPMDIDDVRNLIAWLRNGATEGLSFIDTRSGPKSRPSLHLFVLSLCKLYEQIAGKPPTHNPYLKTDYAGAPLSEAGQFIEFIVRLVDPKVTPTQISTAMGHVLPELRRLEQPLK
jgi:hypothetical protein